MKNQEVLGDGRQNAIMLCHQNKEGMTITVVTRNEDHAQFARRALQITDEHLKAMDIEALKRRRRTLNVVS